MIGDRWVLLIMREFLLGATRFTNFQRAFPRISPTVLSNRLKQMEAN
ncbi:winged helix-turn-helix transcriptional regulator, partial [Erythrobacter ani]